MQNSYVRRLHGLCYLIAERLKLLRSFFHSRLWPKTRLFRPKNKNTESTYVFFGRKIKCRKIKKIAIFGTKNENEIRSAFTGNLQLLKGAAALQLGEEGKGRKWQEGKGNGRGPGVQPIKTGIVYTLKRYMEKEVLIKTWEVGI